jgi:hypothetical protein
VKGSASCIKLIKVTFDWVIKQLNKINGGLKMQEQIEKIELVLENCEVITVEGKHIGDFNCEDIKYSIDRRGCNYIGKMQTCENFSMSIHRDCALNKKSEWSFGYIDEERNPLERIFKGNDITGIWIYFKDRKEPKVIYPKWGDGEYDNEYQESYINQFGDLFIVISKDKNFEDVFNKEEIEDKQAMDFVWEMYE